jgi:hypothetical protein
MMEQVGQHLLQVWHTARPILSGAGTQTSALTFGGRSSTILSTAATEEWTGAGSPTTVTITAS